MASNTLNAISRHFENRDGKGYLYDENGHLLAEFDGEIQESSSLLFVVKNGMLYYIKYKEDVGYYIEKYK